MIPKPAYITSGPHLSGYRVVLGYELLTDAQDAHQYLAALGASASPITGRYEPKANETNNPSNREGDMIVLCEHEFHSSEPGWHCHFTTKPLDSVVAGAVRAGKRKRPTAIDASAVFNVTEATAFDIAAKRYGFEQKGPLI